MSLNDVFVRPAGGSVWIGDDVILHYRYLSLANSQPSCRPVQYLVRSPPESVTLWPGDFVELEVADVDRDSTVSVEPVASSHSHDLGVGPWPSHSHYFGGRQNPCTKQYRLTYSAAEKFPSLQGVRSVITAHGL